MQSTKRKEKKQSRERQKGCELRSGICRHGRTGLRAEESVRFGSTGTVQDVCNARVDAVCTPTRCSVQPS